MSYIRKTRDEYTTYNHEVGNAVLMRLLFTSSQEINKKGGHKMTSVVLDKKDFKNLSVWAWILEAGNMPDDANSVTIWIAKAENTSY